MFKKTKPVHILSANFCTKKKKIDMDMGHHKMEQEYNQRNKD